MIHPEGCWPLEGATAEADLNAGFVGLWRVEQEGGPAGRAWRTRGADAFLEGMFESQVTHNFPPGLAATRRMKIFFLAPTSWSFLGFMIKFRVLKKHPL